MKHGLLLLAVLLLIALLLSRVKLGGDSAELPPLRIICEGDEGQLRCPTECEVGADNQVSCRCRDVYRRSADGELQFFQSQCD